jgi:hypothetical protein
MQEKRGRKRTTEPYFGPNEEAAVVRFLATDDVTEKNKIYGEWLEAPIKKMAESIIRKYKLYRKGFTFEEVRDDAISYLIWKSEKFDVETGFKAYSYYGTIIRHYLLGLIQKDAKVMLKTASFEDSFSSIEEREDLIYYMSDNEYAQEDLIKDISSQIKDELEGKVPDKKKLTENERKVGEALVALLDNWETIFEALEGGSKYNKNIVLATIRDYTNLNTKDIRVSIRRFKQLYFLFKESKIDDGYL